MSFISQQGIFQVGAYQSHSNVLITASVGWAKKLFRMGVLFRNATSKFDCTKFSAQGQYNSTMKIESKYSLASYESLDTSDVKICIIQLYDG